MQWTLKGQATEETWASENICKAEPSVDFFSSKKFAGIGGCANHCEKLNSRMPSVVTLEEWKNLQVFFQRNLLDNGLGGSINFFLALTDVKHEGNWSDYYTDQPLQHEGDFAPGEPNGEERQNCVIQYNRIGWTDYYCDYQCACLCDRKPTSYVRLNGLTCKESAVDTMYLPANSRHDMTKLVYRGTQDTTIEYIGDGKGWKVSVKTENVTGITLGRVSHVSFALGKNNWTIKGDTDCNNGEFYTLPLKLTACKEGNFTCDDGQCIAMEERCDQLPQCRDESDEIGCEILVLKRPA